LSALPSTFTLPFPSADLLHHEGLGSDFAGIAYLSGSLVEGFGNSSSDIDLFVISDRQPKGGTVIEKVDHLIAIHFHGRRRVDFEFWTPTHALEIAARLRRMVIGREFLADKLDLPTECFIHRIRIGIPLTDTTSFEDLRAQFDFKLFSAYQTQQAIHRIDGAHDDVVGMLDDKDWSVLIPRAIDLVSLAVDAYCFSKGATNPLSKWRAKKLAALPVSDRTRVVNTAYLNLCFPHADELLKSPALCEAFGRKCITFANEVVSWIQA
jgi:hypothetical protein